MQKGPYIDALSLSYVTGIGSSPITLLRKENPIYPQAPTREASH